MDLDATVVWLATRGPEDLSKAIEAGITPDLFIGDWSEVWSFIRSYTADHSVTPGAKLLFERFGAMVEEPEEIPALKYMVGKMYERSIRRMLKAGLSDAAEKLDDGDIDSCIASAHALSHSRASSRALSARGPPRRLRPSCPTSTTSGAPTAERTSSRSGDGAPGAWPSRASRGYARRMSRRARPRGSVSSW